MTFTPVPTVATGDIWTAANHNTYIRDNFAAGIPAIFNAAGDLVYASADNVAARLGIGSVGQILKVSSSNLPAWEAFALKLGKANRSSNQSMSSGSLVTVSFTTEEFDTGGFFDLGSHSTRATILEAGKYLFIGQAQFEFATGYKDIILTKSGYEVNVHSDAAGGGRFLVVSGLLNCSVNDYFELVVTQGSGSTMYLQYGSLSIVKVG